MRDCGPVSTARMHLLADQRRTRQFAAGRKSRGGHPGFSPASLQASSTARRQNSGRGRADDGGRPDARQHRQPATGHAEGGATTGLYPPGMDLKAQSLKLLKSQVAGFYDPYDKEMVLVEGGDNLGFWNGATEFMIQRDIVGEMLLAHELTHALQDQNFDLEASLDKVKDDDDRGLALKAVAEGDATIAGFAYAVGRMDTGVADSLTNNLKNLPQALKAEAPDTPEGLSVPMLFQYSDGVRFVAEAYRRGGWSAVDALYRNPPQSTHQVLHPELYFDTPAVTPRIQGAGYDQIMSGWKVADTDTFGELLLSVILERNLGKQSNELGLAARWTGDRMIILQESRGVNVIWMLTFIDTQSAAHFTVVYQTLLDRLLGDSTPHRIDTRANAVLVVIGEGADYFDTLAPSIWNASTIQSGKVTVRFPPAAASDD